MGLFSTETHHKGIYAPLFVDLYRIMEMINGGKAGIRTLGGDKPSTILSNSKLILRFRVHLAIMIFESRDYRQGLLNITVWLAQHHPLR
jgi:hypothetical protein